MPVTRDVMIRQAERASMSGGMVLGISLAMHDKKISDLADRAYALICQIEDSLSMSASKVKK